MQGTRKSDRGLGRSQKSATIVTFENGTKARLWGFANGRQVSNLQRQRKTTVASVQHAIVEDGGRGGVIRVEGTFRLDGLNLVAA